MVMKSEIKWLGFFFAFCFMVFLFFFFCDLQIIHISSHQFTIKKKENKSCFYVSLLYLSP